MKEFLCRLGLHLWKYPEKWKGVNWVKGVHRVCKTCKLEQSQFMFGGWEEHYLDLK